MRTWTMALLLLAACGSSPSKLAVNDAAPEPADLSHPRAPEDLSASLPMDAGVSLDLAQPLPDLSPMQNDCDGNCSVCGPGQLSTQGQCRAIQTQAQCAALSRQFVAVGLIGYCGDCAAPAQAFYGYCAGPMCGSAPGSLGALCQALGRTCTGGGDAGVAACGGCLSSGATLDVPTQACVPTACNARSECPELAGFYCTQLNSTDDPQCRRRLCPAGKSWNRTAAGSSPTSQACTDCASCNGGEWPVTDAQGVCYCTAGPNQFYNHIAAKHDVELCDQDGDGWIKKEVQDELKRVASNTPGYVDYTVLFNVQCTVPVFTSVELHNEWQQLHTVHMTDVGLPEGGVAMYEDTDNDTGKNLDLTVDGLTLSPASANSLTKACSSATSDLNKNGFADATEDQGAVEAKITQWAQPYQRFTHFVELYHAHYEWQSNLTSVAPCVGCAALPIAGTAGKLVIEERSRCSGDFPMQFSSSENAYWQNCTRRRDNAYSVSTQLGYDFASYDCDTPADLACQYTWPDFWGLSTSSVTPPPPIAGLTADGSVPPHGLCDGGVVKTTDPWRGMTAYSQFMCGHVYAAPPPGGLQRTDVLTTNVNSIAHGGSWEAFSCAVTQQTPATPGPGSNAGFSCVEVANGAEDGKVTWLARRYSGTGYTSTTTDAYSGGCIDEGAEWPALCPGDEGDARGNGEAFGELECAPPCPSSEMLLGSTYGLCLHPSQAAFGSGDFWSAMSASKWQFSGEVPLGSGGGQLQSGGCSVDGGVCFQLN